MAAIAEISSFQEWDDEWKVVEEDFQNFKVRSGQRHLHKNLEAKN